MAIDAEEVKRIARLARLELEDEGVVTLCGQLQAILGYVAVLDTLTLEGVPETAHTLEEPPSLRPDEPATSLTEEAALANAPDSFAGFFRVPRVLGE